MSLASNRVLRAKGQGSGASAPEYLGTFDQDTPYLKTSQHSFLETAVDGLSEFSGTFPRSGMMSNGTVYRLPNLARTITEIGSGLYATPRSCSAMAATITENTANAKFPNLETQIARMLPTPCSRDYKGARSAESLEKAGRDGTNSLPDSFAVSNISARLNPQFVEILMGYPLNHTLID